MESRNWLLTSKYAANMSSDSVNISGAGGFFELAPKEKEEQRCNESNVDFIVYQIWLHNISFKHQYCNAHIHNSRIIGSAKLGLYVGIIATDF